MLVLSRKQSEQIVIDGQIEIEVLKIKGNTVRLGIKAPRDVKVLRGELKPFGMADSSEDQPSHLNGAQIFEATLPICQAS